MPMSVWLLVMVVMVLAEEGVKHALPIKLNTAAQKFFPKLTGQTVEELKDQTVPSYSALTNSMMVTQASLPSQTP